MLEKGEMGAMANYQKYNFALTKAMKESRDPAAGDEKKRELPSDLDRNQAIMPISG